jgi:molybdopterin synthase sulfur carrier subunit
MATVWIPALLRHLTHGRETLEVAGGSVRQIIDNLESLCPGIKARLCDGDALRRGMAVAVDSQLAREGLGQAVPEGSEVHFVPSISGGEK